jgi:hypothetical protein
MPSVIDAVLIDIWKLYKDGALRGGFVATYDTKYGELVMQRRDDELVATLNGEQQTIKLWHAGARSKSTFKMETMLCPDCGKSCLRLYLHEAKIKCRHCHKLDFDKLASLNDLERELAEATEILKQYELEKSLKLNAAWVRVGNLDHPGKTRKRIITLNRKIAQARLELWKAAPV